LLASLLVNAAIVAGVLSGLASTGDPARRKATALVSVELHDPEPARKQPRRLESKPPTRAPERPVAAMAAIDPEAAPPPTSPVGKVSLPAPTLDDAHRSVEVPAPEFRTPASPVTASRAPERHDEEGVDSYRQLVSNRILAARPRGAIGQGTVIVRFVLDREGRLANVEIARSSGQFALDRLALQSVRRAAPFPPPPAGLAASALTFQVPFDFHG